MRPPRILAGLLLLVAPSLAAAQVGSTTDIITGTVRNTENHPVANARVEVMSVELGTTRIRTTNEEGQYTLLFPDGGGQYSVTVRAIGLQPATVSLIRLADEDRLVADFRLSPTVASLGTVVVSARQTPQLGPTVGRRLQLQVGLVNPLAGLDQLLHGTDGPRWWGQPTHVDNTLLYVRDFDPLAGAFRYLVNERFGSSALSRSALRNPFQISLTARMQVGVDRQRQLLEGALRAGANNRAGLDVRNIVRRLAPNPIRPLMDMRSELKLTAAQIATLKAIGDSLDAKTAELIGRLDAQMQKEAKSGGDLQTLFPKLQPLLQEARNNYVQATQSIQKALTSEQWADVPESVKNPALRPGGGGGGRRIPPA